MSDIIIAAVVTEMKNNSLLSSLNAPPPGYLLLVEDDPRIQANSKELLERRGYAIKQAFSLRDAWAVIENDHPRAIILDMQLPDGSGMDFLREIRKTSTVPVLMLTGMDTSEDMIEGLQTGGDAYLTKPYDLGILLTHLEALLRRSAMVPNMLTFGPLRLIPSSNTAYLNGGNMLLAQKEFALLQLFIQHPDTTISAEHLYEKVWGQDMTVDDSAIKNAIYRLKKKLAGSEYTINAERGEGYRFERS